MPCRDYEDDTRVVYRDSKETTEDLRAARERNDQLARMLCGLLTKMEETGAMAQLPPLKGKEPEYQVLLLVAPGHGPGESFNLDDDLAVWWTRHKRRDAKRKAVEEHQRNVDRADAWGRLTDKDLEVLGLTRPTDLLHYNKTNQDDDL